VRPASVVGALSSVVGVASVLVGDSSSSPLHAVMITAAASNPHTGRVHLFRLIPTPRNSISLLTNQDVRTRSLLAL
jgi:hypothetical protein